MGKIKMGVEKSTSREPVKMVENKVMPPKKPQEKPMVDMVPLLMDLQTKMEDDKALVSNKLTKLSEQQKHDAKQLKDLMDSYVSINTENMNKLSEEIQGIKKKQLDTKKEITVVEKEIKTDQHHECEKRQEIGLELDRIEQSVKSKLEFMANIIEHSEELNIKSEKTIKMCYILMGMSTLITIINFFI